MDTVRIFDTTLRDGEQSPGATLTLPEKMEIARHLQAMGVDIIEAGFPVSSPGDFESVNEIAREITRSVICGLARCSPKDIDRAGEAVKPAVRSRIHLFCATSKIHREHKLRKGKEEILNLAVRSIQHALQYTADVEFSPEDASRTELEFLRDIVIAAIEAGATTINMPDTVGYATPKSYGEIFAVIRQLPIVRERNVVLSAHCHDDLGLSVANSLAAVENGARQVECTINGIGERAGNAALEEVVMALRTRVDHFNVRTNIDTTKIYSASRMVSALTGLSVQRNKAIVGENAFAHEAGIHQDGILKFRETYEIMDPASVGVPNNSLVLGKHSGRHAFRDRIAALGYAALTEEHVEAAFAKFKALADKKKEVFDEDLEALVDEQLEVASSLWELAGLQVTAGSNTIPTATVTLRDSTAQTVTDASVGDGPVDAIYSAIARLTGITASLTDYRIRAVSKGKDAMGEVQIELEHSGRKIRGRGLSTDILEASALAYLAAINRLRSLSNREKSLSPHAEV